MLTANMACIFPGPGSKGWGIKQLELSNWPRSLASKMLKLGLEPW